MTMKLASVQNCAARIMDMLGAFFQRLRPQRPIRANASSPHELWIMCSDGLPELQGYSSWAEAFVHGIDQLDGKNVVAFKVTPRSLELQYANLLCASSRARHE